MPEFPAPDFTQLLDWIEGRLSAEEASSVAAHVAHGDQATLATIAWLRSFQHAQAALVLEAPPPTLHTELMQRFAAARQKPGILQRIIAALSFDSNLQPALAGARGGAATQKRQLLFSSDLADLALHVLSGRADQQIELSGQLFLKDLQLDSPCIIQLQHNEQTIAEISTDELGEFSFTKLAPDSYTIIIRRDTAQIVCGPIHVEY